MRVLLVVYLILVGAVFAASAQDAPELVLLNTRLETRPDGFGGEARVVTGEIFNHGETAYRNVTIAVEAFNADEELIGEGFGYLVDACGSALLEYDLPPGRTQTFEAPYEIFAAGEAARVETTADAEAAAPESAICRASGLSASVADSGFSGDFHKSAIAAIAVERVARSRAVAVRGKGGPVDYVEVEVAIGVVVEEGCTAAVGF